jgi:hypothetical protein
MLMKKTISIISLLLISTTSIAGDLEGNTMAITVKGNTIVSNQYTGSANYAGASLGVGGKAVVNGVDINCSTSSSCGNDNAVTIDVTGDTTVSGGNAIVNGVSMNSD